MSSWLQLHWDLMMCFQEQKKYVSMLLSSLLIEEQSENREMDENGNGGMRNALGQSPQPESTHGYRPMTTGPQRLSGIPRRCLLGTPPASGVSLPDNTYSHFLSPKETLRLLEEVGDGNMCAAAGCVTCRRSLLLSPFWSQILASRERE